MTERDVDVLVIGSGVAGLSAALEASQRGHSVLVFEAADQIGGASVMAGAACCLVGTPEQEAAGIVDSVELALWDWSNLGGPTADLVWAEKYLRASKTEVRDWTASLGIEWGAPADSEGNSVFRWHLPKTFGVGIVTAILERCRALGVEVRTGSPVTRLVTDGDSVVGAETTDGRIDARAVVVATGGFCNSAELLAKFAPHLFGYPRFLRGSSPTSVGGGTAMLEQVGARFTAMNNIWIYPNGTPDPSDPSGERGIGLRGIVTELWFNLDSERFFNEAHRGGHSGTRALRAQPGMTAWCVFDGAEVPTALLIDNEYYATPSGPIPERMTEFWETSDYAVRADTIAELAERTGLDGGKLDTAIGTFNDAIAQGLDADPVTGRALAGLRPIGREGYAAIRFFPLAQKNFGGVQTDLECRVLREDGTVIPGLFAAGEAAGMAGGSINGHSGLEGTMFGPSLYSGRIAGIAAAAELDSAITAAGVVPARE